MAGTNKEEILKIVGKTVEYENFIDLHNHLDTSLLDGVTTAAEIAAICEHGAALTDHGNMYSVLSFQDKMINAGKKPIFGFEAYTDSILTGDDNSRYHLILLAIDNEGLRNLYKLTSMSFENIHTKPVVKWDWLRKLNKGIICLTGCLAGELDTNALVSKESARRVLVEMRKVFGKRLYVEIQRHHIHKEEIATKIKVQLAKELGIDYVATSDSHYPSKDFAEAQLAALCVQTKSTIDKPSMKFDGDGYHLHTTKEMLELFSDYPEAVYNTTKIFNACHAYVSTGEYFVPKFDIPKGFDSEMSYLKHLVWEGYKEKTVLFPHYKGKEYTDRLTYELSVVERMKYAGYFLIVWDFVNYAHENGIYVGPGRGSAAGSLMLNCLKVTDFDPIKYDLLFERFLNPDRISMPDIDMDFEHERREDVISYVREKYGKECVSKIITFGTLAPKAVIKDIGKVYGFDFTTRNTITKAMTCDTLAEESKNPAFMNLVSERHMEKVLELSQKLENRNRHASQHACGLLIAPDDVKEFLPTCMMTSKTDKRKRELTTQVTMTEVERMGLLKFDFLGLRTLSCIKWTIKFIKETYNVDIDMNSIPLDDPYVYNNLKKSTLGVFQLESDGMFNLMQELYQDIDIKTIENNPEKDWGYLFERIIAGVALYRPGPMDEIPNYISNMLGTIKYDHPMLAPILAPTYGIFVYQEQITRACQVLAGFSGGQADYVRKGMGKKIQEIIDENREYFIYGSEELGIKGCINNGILEETAIVIWEKMEKFGRYAFNKSHAATYAKLTIITAWLAYYYPECFFAGLLNSYIDKADVTMNYLIHIKQTFGEIILPPSISSKSYFTIEQHDGKEMIRFGIKGVKGVGSALDNLPESCKTSFESYVKAALNYVNATSLIKLAYIGFFETFNINRKTAVFSIMAISELFSAMKKIGTHTWLSVLNTSMITEEKEYSKESMLKREKEFIGYYLSGHPTDAVPEMENTIKVNELKNHVDKKVTVVVSIEKIDKKETKNSGKVLKILDVEDKTGNINVVCFDNFLQKYDDLIKDQVIVLTGTVKLSDFGLQLVAESASLPKSNNALNRMEVTFTTLSIEQARLTVDRMLPFTQIESCENKVKLDVVFNNQIIPLGFIPETYTSQVLKLISNQKVTYN